MHLEQNIATLVLKAIECWPFEDHSAVLLQQGNHFDQGVLTDCWVNTRTVARIQDASEHVCEDSRIVAIPFDNFLDKALAKLIREDQHLEFEVVDHCRGVIQGVLLLLVVARTKWLDKPIFTRVLDEVLPSHGAEVLCRGQQ